MSERKPSALAAHLVFIAAVTVAAFFVRFYFFPYASADYYQFLHGWFMELKACGGLAAIGHNIGDYMPPYFYLLALLTYIPAPDIVLIKMLSFAGDIIMACFTMRIVQRKGKKFQGELAYAIILFLPSVVLNSAVWGQCDSIYTAALLACVYYIMEDRQYAAITAFSIAFVFKLQTVFLAPFILLMLLKHKIQWRSILVFPAVYVVSILPAALMGRNFGELMTVYFRQAHEYTDICMNLPNLAAWFPEQMSQTAGAVFAICGILLSLAAVLLLRRLNFQLTDSSIATLALFSVIFVPYFLPHMHERYFYPADILSVIFAFYFPAKFYVPIITVFSSTVVVCGFLFSMNLINLKLLSIMMLFCLILVGASIVALARRQKENTEVQPND
jgi:Gpi18-like mannosyltransferase